MMADYWHVVCVDGGYVVDIALDGNVTTSEDLREAWKVEERHAEVIADVFRTAGQWVEVRSHNREKGRAT